LSERQASGRAGRRFAAIWIAATVLLATTSSRAVDIPTLLVLPLEMADTSGETPSRAKELEDRLTTLTLTLSRELGAHGLYSVIDPTSIGTEIDKARATEALDRCNGCERDLARLVHADRVLIGAVDKVSTLIGSLRLNIVDVATGRRIFSRVLGFAATRMRRGNAPRDSLSAIWKRLPWSGGECVRVAPANLAAFDRTQHCAISSELGIKFAGEPIPPVGK
jgi:hypothetical protein